MSQSFVRSSVFAIVTFAAVVASAQPKAEGFALNRYEPSDRGSDWFANESLDLRGHLRGAAGLVLDYGHKPLVVYDLDGDERSTIVENQLFGHVGGAIVLSDMFRVGLNLPVAIWQSGDGGSTANQTFESSNATTIGDVRLSGNVRLLGHYGAPLTLAAGLWAHLPTGSRDAFTGDGNVRIHPQLMAAGDIDLFTYAVRAGVNVRGNSDDFAGSPTGSEMTFAGALGARLLNGKITLGPEFFGSTVVTDADAFFKRRTSPFEVVFGGHFQAAKQVKVGVGVGPGMTRAFGTPQLRMLAGVEWVEPAPEKTAPPPPADRDGDGIYDKEDACPDVPGVRTDDPKTNGCPPPGDRDKDTIIDPEDACPDEPGVKTDDPKTNGCPAPKDTDGDGILDPVDACPEAAGPANDDPKKHGCPVARVEKGQIRILEQVQFAYNSDRILKASDYILEAVKKVLEEHSQIKLVEVQGHTDSKGGDQFNLGLSKRRAASVMKWLTGKGVDKKRLKSQGFGKKQPIDTNETEEGRANNRRVEFHILEQEKPAN
ncbi:MAG: OmpA family protein [Polyangiaceae bacterium]|nr:OmpA family protein [Polyangiaceae bacterium]